MQWWPIYTIASPFSRPIPGSCTGSLVKQAAIVRTLRSEDAEHTEDTEDNVYSETRQLDLIQLAADVCAQGTEEETSR